MGVHSFNLLFIKDVNKAKQFFPYLQRAGRSEAIVEHVQAGGRVRVYVPKETVLATLLLGGLCFHFC